MSAYIITTESGYKWLIEEANSEADALEQYYDGDAERHISVEETDDEEEMGYLRGEGQAS
jgi:hypothetical protein